MESLKAIPLVESPLPFHHCKIFVSEIFLSRARSVRKSVTDADSVHSLAASTSKMSSVHSLSNPMIYSALPRIGLVAGAGCDVPRVIRTRIIRTRIVRPRIVCPRIVCPRIVCLMR
jgi:hypothetical protein